MMRYTIYIKKIKENVGEQETKKEQMVKVFLVEDEIVIRDGIKTAFNGKKRGLSLSERPAMENWLTR